MINITHFTKFTHHHMYTTATRYRKEFNLPASWVGDNEEASIQAFEQFFVVVERITNDVTLFAGLARF